MAGDGIERYQQLMRLSRPVICRTGVGHIIERRGDRATVKLIDEEKPFIYEWREVQEMTPWLVLGVANLGVIRMGGMILSGVHTVHAFFAPDETFVEYLKAHPLAENLTCHIIHLPTQTVTTNQQLGLLVEDAPYLRVGCWLNRVAQAYHFDLSDNLEWALKRFAEQTDEAAGACGIFVDVLLDLAAGRLLGIQFLGELKVVLPTTIFSEGITRPDG